ncbi:hypothetical protein GCM10023156_21560 [Novipirellula rosea]|uniref:Uncharacterized protein n=1 Tax=Novipirellula rosea TaxID=1031540 RepID=A0ABP8MNJ9_9BACT
MRPSVINDRLSTFSCCDERVNDRDTFSAWASGRWPFHESRGPLGALPVRRAYAIANWRGTELDHYAGLYPRDTATDILDFALFEAYTCSIQQSIIRDSEPDLDWFRPDDLATGVAGFVRYITDNDSIYAGFAIQRRIAAWQLPPEFAWLSELNINEGFLFESTSEAHICAATDEGFLTFMALNG